MKYSKRLFQLTVIFCLLAILTSAGRAATESISVGPGKEITRIIDLAAGDRSSVTFTVTGPSPSTVHFFMVLPNGTASDYGEVSRCTIDFSTDVQGTCELHFDNGSSSGAELVTLNYDVEHYIFGIPQMLFLVIAVAVLLLFVVAGYVAMGKYG